MVRNVGVMSLEQIFVENRKLLCEATNGHSLSIAIYRQIENIFFAFGFLFWLFRDVKFCQIRLQLAGRKKEMNDEEKKR